MCSPYNYMEEKKKKVLGSLDPITSTVNNGRKILIIASKSKSTAAVDGAIIPKLNRRKIFLSKKSHGSSPLSYISILVLILLALEFFALADSAVVTQKILKQNDKLVLITTWTKTTLSPQENDQHPSILLFSSPNNQNNESNKKIKTRSGNDHVDSSSRSTERTSKDMKAEFHYFTIDPTEKMNCTEPTILDFPPDLVADLPHGSLLVHIVISLYIFYAIAYLCDAFFVPSIELICKVIHLPTDVAGATFMAIATSSPEFFTNVIGTFVTKGDIGVGSVVGSVVFNLLAIVAWCGLAVKAALKIEWWPLTRDIFFYILSVIFLIVFLWDGVIAWYEALVLVLAYCGYIALICNNRKVQRIVENWISRDPTIITTPTSLPVPSQERLRELLICSLSYDGFKSSNESTPLLSDKSGRYVLKPALSSTEGSINCNSESFHGGHLPKNNVSQHNHQYQNLRNSLEKVQEKDDENFSKESHETEVGLFELPRGQSYLKWFEWVMGWPVRLILHLTIPDCRLLKSANWYPVTFFMCIVYMAVFSYVITWMMTVIGQILGIPDAIVGLTFVAMGTSLPEAVSSIIVARQGLGTMSISNSVGSNTFNILLCLGLPWLLKNTMLAVSGAAETALPMTSGGFGYVSIYLVASAILIYIIIAWNDFLLDFKVGIFALVMYILFLILASLLELNVFFPVNLPTCKI